MYEGSILKLGSYLHISQTYVLVTKFCSKSSLCPKVKRENFYIERFHSNFNERCNTCAVFIKYNNELSQITSIIHIRIFLSWSPIMIFAVSICRVYFGEIYLDFPKIKGQSPVGITCGCFPSDIRQFRKTTTYVNFHQLVHSVISLLNSNWIFSKFTDLVLLGQCVHTYIWANYVMACIFCAYSENGEESSSDESDRSPAAEGR